MSDYYTKAAFFIDVSNDEAEFMRECFEISERLEDGMSGESDWESYEKGTSETFKRTFPAESRSNPFGQFRKLFDDQNYPTFGCHIHLNDHVGEGKEGCSALLRGDHMDVEAVSKLIQLACKSALPFGFEWSTTSDLLDLGEQGGGYFVISESEIKGGSTESLMREALAEIRCDTHSRPQIG